MTRIKGLNIVPLEEGHIQPITAIEKQIQGAPWSEQSFRNELKHEHGIFRCALLDNQVIGYAGMWLVVDEAHIITVSIAPEHQRKGIGRELMMVLLNIAKEKGMICASLEVRAGNIPAIRLYESLGFVQAAVRKGYYPDNKEDALVMWLHNLDKWEGKS